MFLTQNLMFDFSGDLMTKVVLSFLKLISLATPLYISLVHVALTASMLADGYIELISPISLNDFLNAFSSFPSSSVPLQ